MPASPRSAWPNGAVRPVWASNLPSPPGRPTRGGGDGAGSPPQSDCGPRTLGLIVPRAPAAGRAGELARSERPARVRDASVVSLTK